MHPIKPGDGTVSLADLQVRVDPPAEWNQMYHEVWRVERAYFYDPNFHGVNTVEEEKRFAPYVQSIASRSDLNYIFQEMLSGFSVGHLRGTGGEIPEAKKVPGGLLGADYTIENGHYCVSKILGRRQLEPGRESSTRRARTQRAHRRLHPRYRRAGSKSRRRYPAPAGGNRRPCHHAAYRVIQRQRTLETSR